MHNNKALCAPAHKSQHIYSQNMALTFIVLVCNFEVLYATSML